LDKFEIVAKENRYVCIGDGCRDEVNLQGRS